MSGPGACVLRSISCAALRRAQAALPVPADARRWIIAIAVLFAALPSRADTVSVSVFGLFRPSELVAGPVPGSRLSVSIAERWFGLEGGQNAQLVRQGGLIVVSRGEVNFRGASAAAIPHGAMGRFVLEVPGKIRREFEGTLAVRVRGGALEAVVEMDLESAVAAIVAAEAGDAPLAALAAQAVAARSYLSAAAGRHAGFQFCDTTHCQYLAGTPEAGSRAWQAVLQTRGLVLAYRGTRFAPLYTRFCGGTTLTASDVGFSRGAYAFQRVRCPVCSRESNSWQRDLPASDLSAIVARPGNETARLEVARKLGWSSVPGNRYEIRREGDRVRIEGAGEGHGVGLCQRGAAGLAGAGWSFREILSFYLPDTMLVGLSLD